MLEEEENVGWAREQSLLVSPLLLERHLLSSASLTDALSQAVPGGHLLVMNAGLVFIIIRLISAP